MLNTIWLFYVGSGDLCFENSCYLFKESGKRWTDSQNTCKGKGGDLVSIETEEEWQFINDEIQKLCIGHYNEWHIGLKKVKDEWTWVSGSPLTINKWQPQEPNDDGDVAAMAKEHPANKHGLFKDIPAGIIRAFICELPKGKIIDDN